MYFELQRQGQCLYSEDQLLKPDGVEKWNKAVHKR